MRLPALILTLIVLLCLVIVLLEVGHFREERIIRRTKLIGAMGFLNSAYKEYAQGGYLGYTSSSWRIWPTNVVASIGGTNYQCVLAAKFENHWGRGSLALTTNGVFIWLDEQGPPKIANGNIDRIAEGWSK